MSAERSATARSATANSAAALFDPGDPKFLADPYPVFARLRERGAVHFHPGLGMPVAVSHAACSAVLRGRGLGRVWTDARPAEEFRAFNLLHRNSLLENEPPTHTRLRRLVSGAFARGHVARLRPRVEKLVHELLDDLRAGIAEHGHADLMARLANPLPVRVIAELLGVPDDGRHLLQPWSNTIVRMYEYGLDEAAQRAAERAAAEFTGYLRELAAHRARRPAEDLITDLTAELDADELVATAALLLMAGHEASVHTVGNGVHALLRNPEQWRMLIAHPELVESCVEEIIRYDSPLQCFERTATEDVEIAGHRVRRGGKIAALLGAAAHDPDVFPNPSTMDIRRASNPHLGFGAGIHYCLGAPLARLEAAAALRALATRMPELHPAAVPRRRAEFVIRGLATLPVAD